MEDVLIATVTADLASGLMGGWKAASWTAQEIAVAAGRRFQR